MNTADDDREQHGVEQAVEMVGHDDDRPVARHGADNLDRAPAACELPQRVLARVKDPAAGRPVEVSRTYTRKPRRRSTVGLFRGHDKSQTRGGKRRRWLLLGLGAGAALQYLRDPQQGRTRRARLKDQATARVRRPVRSAESQYQKQTTLAHDRAAGIAHEVKTSDAERIPEDDRALVDKIRSEALGGEDWRPYTINVDAVNGVVTLHGQLDRQDQISAVERAVRGVPGVVSVESFLHLPGGQPRNVEEAHRASSP